jgi:hypothetical protein
LADIQFMRHEDFQSYRPVERRTQEQSAADIQGLQFQLPGLDRNSVRLGLLQPAISPMKFHWRLRSLRPIAAPLAGKTCQLNPVRQEHSNVRSAASH